MSAQVAEQARDPALGLRFPLIYVTRPRMELHARIADRTRAMLRAGWIAETEALMREHGPEARALRAIGYREVVACIQGTLAPGDLEERIVTATRQYAKRQETWFRPLPKAAAGAPEDPAVREALARLLDEAGDRL
jgi:tRNA dimethylallyltransferase